MVGDVLDNCGPIGFLQLNDTTVYNKRASSSAPRPVTLPGLETPPTTDTSLGVNYLVNITVGEDFANCYTCLSSTACDRVMRYGFGREVWVQCYSTVLDAPTNETYWYETTDFCYVREVDFFQSLFDRKLVKLVRKHMHR